MTLGDLMDALRDKGRSIFGVGNMPTPTTANLPALQAQYQDYALGEMTKGRQPMSFQDWVAAQQQQRP